MAAEALDPFWYEEFDTSQPLPSLCITAVRIAARPRQFFARLDPEGGYLSALTFALLCSAGYAIASGLAADLGVARVEERSVTGAALLGGMLRTAALCSVALVVSGPLVVGLFHLFVRGHRGYRTTFRVLYYSAAPLVWIGWLPIVGLLLAGVWAVFLATLGMREVHGASSRRSAVAVLVPTVLIAAPAILTVTVGLPWLAELRGAS